MNKDFWTAAGLIFGGLVSTPLVLASIRAIFFFGQVSQSVKNMETRFNEHVVKIDAFIDEMHTYNDQTDKRLTNIEAERRAEEKFGRRSSDRDVTKNTDRM